METPFFIFSYWHINKTIQVTGWISKYGDQQQGDNQASCVIAHTVLVHAFVPLHCLDALPMIFLHSLLLQEAFPYSHRVVLLYGPKDSVLNPNISIYWNV